MANLAFASDYSNVIQFRVVDGGRDKQNENSPKKHNNKVAGDESEVYAFRSEEEIASMIDVFDKHIREAKNECHRKIASRDKMLFIVGINLGIRASDLRELKYSFFFEKLPDGSLNFKEYYKFIPIKTRKSRKFVKVYFNDAVRQAVCNYISEYPVSDLDDYLFVSRKGNKPVTVDGIRKIVKNAAEEAGIVQNIGTHSLRKTFAYQIWHKAEDKNKALITLQTIFSHSSPSITAKYIGITNDEVKDMFDGLNLGIDMI